MMNMQLLCEQVIELTKTTGVFLKNFRTNLTTVDVESKGLHNYVTAADKESERRLVEGLSALLPEAGFVAEEGTSDKKGEVFNWIIDPIDGTTNFIHGLPCYCISIGLMRHSELVLGVVYDPSADECFYAWEGSKAYLNGKEISVTKVDNLHASLVATGFPYTDFGVVKEYLALFEEMLHSCSGLRRLGSAALDIVYVACGRFEAFYEYGLKPWDVAGGAFILQQAGGTVSTFHGEADVVFGPDFIGSNSKVHGELISIVEKYFVK